MARVTAPGLAGRQLVTDLLARPQLDSLALALAAFATVFPGRNAVSGRLQLRHGLPARFEVLRDGAVTVVLDSAHTEESVRALFADLGVRCPGRPVHLVFGTAVDKRWRAALSAVSGRVDKAWVAPIDSPRTEDPELVAQHLRQLGVVTNVARRGVEALAMARAAAAQDAVIVVTGSAYLAGEVRTGLVPRVEPT
jgi:dihydrofolate synthase / folylpolyglutamate synthase